MNQHVYSYNLDETKKLKLHVVACYQDLHHILRFSMSLLMVAMIVVAMLVFCHVQLAVPVIVATAISVAMIHVGLFAIVFFRVIAAGMSLRHDQSSLTTMAGCVDCIVSTTKDTTSDEVTPSMPSTGRPRRILPWLPILLCRQATGPCLHPCAPEISRFFFSLPVVNVAIFFTSVRTAISVASLD